MTTYGVGTKVFCDFIECKPEGVAVRVVEPGTGRVVTEGLVEVRLTQSRGAYKKGEILSLKACRAVPIAQGFHKPGSCFRYVNTSYEWK